MKGWITGLRGGRRKEHGATLDFGDPTHRPVSVFFDNFGMTVHNDFLAGGILLECGMLPQILTTEGTEKK